jgi:hypothetical protein
LQCPHLNRRHTHTHIHIHTHMHTYTHTHITYTYIHTHTHTGAWVPRAHSTRTRGHNTPRTRLCWGLRRYPPTCCRPPPTRDLARCRSVCGVPYARSPGTNQAQHRHRQHMRAQLTAVVSGGILRFDGGLDRSRLHSQDPCL